MLLDGIDKKLINLVQMKFPLKPSPYRELGLKLGFNEDEVIRRIGQLKANNIIRQISLVLDTRRLGYGTTLTCPPKTVPVIMLDYVSIIFNKRSYLLIYRPKYNKIRVSVDLVS